MDADRAQSQPAASPDLARPREPPSRDAGAHGVDVDTDMFQPTPAGDDAWPAGLGGAGRRFGSFVPVLPTDSPSSRTNGRRARRRLTVVYTLLVALLVAGVAVAAGLHGHLHRTDDELATVRSRLQGTIHRAHQAEASLAAVSTQSAAAAKTLAAETAQLSAAQAQLASTEVNVFANGVSINDLDLCVAGVERALNQISLNDQQGAAASLNGVAAACRAAEPSP